MEKRNKLVAVIFLAFILIVPAVTVVRDLVAPAESGLSEAEQKVLENNGSLQKEDGDESESGEEMETAQEDVGAEQEDGAPVEEAVGFARLQNILNSFTERLFGRTRLIAFNTELTSLITGGTYIESTQVLLGKNDMFFYKTELDGHPIWDYMGINHFTDEELAAIADNLVATRDYLASRGIEFYVMCAPNKEIIYPENMPDTIARVDEVSRGEQLAEYIAKNTDLIFVYPKDALLEAKKYTQIYYKTDTHCNQKGSFVMMQELFRAAYGTHAELSSVSFRCDSTDYLGDLATLAGLGDDDKYKIDDVYVFERDTADPSQYHDQTLLFVGDSFGGFLSAVCKGYYKYDEVYWEYPDSFNIELYDKYKPDVVIWERAERYCEKFGADNLRK